MKPDLNTRANNSESEVGRFGITIFYHRLRQLTSDLISVRLEDKMKKLLAIFVWFPISIVTLVFNLVFLSYHQVHISQKSGTEIIFAHIPYNFYSAIPRVLGAKTTDSFDIESQDFVPQLIRNYLNRYQSPMLESSNNFVSIARQYGIDPLFMLSIAQCESNLGKKMPHKTDDKYECHNPFGWGIHQDGTLCFETWEQGYEAVSKGLKEKYYGKGYETTEEIMTKYTPPALEKEGSWAKCVNHFLDKLNREYQSYSQP